MYIILEKSINYNDECYYTENGYDLLDRTAYKTLGEAKEEFYKKTEDYIIQNPDIISNMSDFPFDENFCSTYLGYDKEAGRDGWNYNYDYLNENFQEKFKKLPIPLKRQLIDKMQIDFFSIQEIKLNE